MGFEVLVKKIQISWTVYSDATSFYFPKANTCGCWEMEAGGGWKLGLGYLNFFWQGVTFLPTQKIRELQMLFVHKKQLFQWTGINVNYPYNADMCEIN